MRPPGGDSALIPALSGGLSLESGFGRSLADCALGIGRGTGRWLCRGEAAAACQRGVAAPHFRGIHACGGSEVNLMMWGVAAIGFFSGIISGMGIGGGTILIPALLFLTEVNQQQAQGVNLIYFIPTAVVALITHRKNGTLDLKTAKPLALLGLAGGGGRGISGGFAGVGDTEKAVRGLSAVDGAQ